MELLKNIGGSAAGMGLGMIGQWAGGWINKGYNEEQAEKAEKRKRSLMEWQATYNSPEEQVKRLKSAGLNPAMIYGQSGATGTMSDVQAPQAQVSTNDSATGMGLQVMMANKQMEVMESQANLNNTNADLARANTSGAQLDNIFKGIQNRIAGATEGTVIETANQGLEEIKTNIENMKKQGNLTDANIDKINTEIDNITVDTLLKESNISLNEVNKEQMRAAIRNMREQIALGKMSIQQGYVNIENQLLIAQLSNKTNISISELNNKTAKEIRELANENNIEVTNIQGAYSLKSIGDEYFKQLFGKKNSADNWEEHTTTTRKKGTTTTTKYGRRAKGF